MRRLLDVAARAFDVLARAWESPRAKRATGALLVVAFLLGLLVIEVNRQGLVPAPVAGMLPTNHFFAVAEAFTLLLLFEVVALVLSLAQSVANSVGKQLEVLSLILLRQSFKEFTTFTEPVDWPQVAAAAPGMLSSVVGALAIFCVLGLYYRVQRHVPITPDSHEQASFVAAKKALALVLLGVFTAIGLHDAWRWLSGGPTYPFFEVLYTVLIFSDLLLALLSLRYSSTYPVVFRNSGFAVATVMLRLGLTAPPPFHAALGVGAALFALALTLAYNAFGPPPLAALPARRDAAIGVGRGGC